MSAHSALRWGIIGTGGIAGSFASDLKYLPDHTIVAVGSRNRSTADAFADRHGIPRRYGTYEELVGDREIDVVYVSTPHPFHCPNSLLALEAGKSVLVEKPFAMNASEAEKMIALAKKKNLFLLEAMWTRFLPHIHELRKILSDGTLGRIVTVHADHGQWFRENPKHRMFAPELGGGALLDLGIYPVSFASLVLGTPTEVTAVSDRTFTGVDAQTSIILRYGSGAHAVLSTTLNAAAPNRAAIVGTEARVEIDRFFFIPTSFTVTARDGRVLRKYENTYTGHGLREQAIETARCLRSGLTESPLLPLEETLSIMKTMDDIRDRIGLTY